MKKRKKNYYLKYFSQQQHCLVLDVVAAEDVVAVAVAVADVVGVEAAVEVDAAAGAAAVNGYDFDAAMM